MKRWGPGVFFECEDDREAAPALFSAAEKWVQKNGMEFFRGPLNPSANYEMGLLIRGFDRSPSFQMTYNPQYYVDLVEAYGFHKEKDILSYEFDKSFKIPAWLENAAQKRTFNGNTWTRDIDLNRIDSELVSIKQIYNDCWSDNWGFAPLSEEEIRKLGHDLAKIADKNLSFFIYLEQELVGMAVIIPNINPLLRKLNGKIGVLGLLTVLLNRKKITTLRGMLLGIKQQYHQLGLPLVAFNHMMKAFTSNGYDSIEFGWDLEDNNAINEWYEDAGGSAYKRWRIYRKSFGIP